MAPVEFSLTYSEGDLLDVLADLIRKKSLVVVASPATWAYLSQDGGLGATTALDLRHFVSAADVPDVAAIPGDLLLLRAPRWDFAPVVSAARASGRPVVLFVANHTWVSGLDDSCALIGLYGGRYTVVGVPEGAGEGRVEDVVWRFSEWERRDWERNQYG